MRLVLSCEHAANFVPPDYADHFVGADSVLGSHRGWDPGSLQMGELFGELLGTTAISAPATRLLVEPNRSLGHPNLFSSYTRGLDPPIRQAILDQFYHPHRLAVQSAIERELARGGPVVHVSLHTFTPQLDGHVRNADVGLLYDSRRPAERAFCDRWQRDIHNRRDELRVRRNYPYLGKADGLTTFLRRRFDAEQYLGFELEVNQRWLDDPGAWQSLCSDLAIALQTTLGCN